MKNIRRAIATAALIPLALTACGTDAGGSASGSSDSKDIVIEMWAGGESDQEAIEAQVDIAKKMLPEYNIELRTAPWGDFFTKLTTNMASGNMACVTGMNSGRLSSYVDGFHELTDADLETAGLSRGDLAPGAEEVLMNKGKLYGIPFDVATMLVYYNEDQLEAAGAPLPEAGWNFDDFEATAKSATANGKDGFAVGMGDFQWMALPISKAGLQPVTEDGTLDLTNEKFAAAADWYAGLVSEQQVAAEVASASELGWGEDQFSNGNAAMAVDGTWNAVSYLTNESGFNVGLAPLPSADGREPLGLVLGSGFGIAKNCENKEAALKVMGALLSEEAQDYVASSGRSYPARTSSQPKYFDSLDEAYRDEVKEAFEAGFANVQGQRVSDEWAQVSAYLTPELVNAYSGRAELSDILATAQGQFS
ncbi:extracellular solute-binding protein [Tessaracoccus sp. ZS01]|uniref:ABC transporter substrate-binding protein n=1 Tax=Tessaracoccus sp. ZS01 TaxID=1906324 RepID=UPI00096C2136|nr:extracellular solute-binding protein [Tessaracoccus sp. ZS01]MCG6568622.1 ABC transporter substrate-binding protein [Tessaracoccus sp. ZS01]OMG52222.1 ABC transporter substrate-binding protein [Tessaracoccus sp. ZS01]